MIDPKSSVPLYLQLKDEIEAKVIQGEYKDNEKLPTQKELCEIYHVSMITVRKALEVLEKHNVVFSTSGKGTFVRTPKFRNELVKITSFSKTLQGEGISGYTKILSYKSFANSNKMKTLMQTEAYGPISSIALLGFGDGIPLVYYCSFVRKDLGEKMYIAAKELESIKTPFSTFDLYEMIGVGIQRMEQSIKAINADKALAELLKIPYEKSVLLLDTMVYGVGGVLLENKSAYYRSDKYAFTLCREQ